MNTTLQYYGYFDFMDTSTYSSFQNFRILCHNLEKRTIKILYD